MSIAEYRSAGSDHGDLADRILDAAQPGHDQEQAEHDLTEWLRGNLAPLP